MSTHLEGSAARSGSFDTRSEAFGARTDRDPGPNFICPGLQKAGTSWLYTQMRAHPDFWMPPVKEISHFDGRTMRKPAHRKQIKDYERRKSGGHYSDAQIEANDDLFMMRYTAFSGGEPDFRWYGRLFACKGAKLSGDISPGYSMLDRRMIESIVRHFPNLRIALLVRDPVARAWSQYCMRIRKHKVGESETGSWASMQTFLHKDRVARRSYPSRIWRDWAEVVERARLRYWALDDIVSRPVEMVDELARFVGAKTAFTDADLVVRPQWSPNRIAMSAAIRAGLARHFAEELERCAELFGANGQRWLEKYQDALS